MIRKLIAGILIVISILILGLSIAGISLIWMFKEPLTQTSSVQLKKLDLQLGQVQTTLQNADLELERTLRIVIDAEKSMLTLKTEFINAKAVFGEMNGTMDTKLIPDLKNIRANIAQAKNTLQELLATLNQINALPFTNIKLPGDKLLTDLINSTDSLDFQIIQVEELGKKASTFAGDASYLMGFDFSETKRNLNEFLTAIHEYDQKLTAGRSQLTWLTQSLPGWIKTVSIGTILFLVWFGISQFGLIIHGLAFWHGNQS
ncbi:MAG: hypothetical protein WCK35_19255 [Chloroflexota bacterium]